MPNIITITTVPTTAPTAAICPYCKQPITGPYLSLRRHGYGVPVHQNCHITAVTTKLQAPAITSRSLQ